MGMIRVSDRIVLAGGEIEESFVRASGPGGQHVNTSSTGVQLRFDVRNSPSLSEAVRSRLLKLAGSRLTREGVLVIEASNFRSQKANREDAMDRLAALIRAAEKQPKRRRKTRPSRASRAKRLDNKQRRGDLKKTRGAVRRTDD